ncbi:fasciclin domain-containing protein [Pedobacter caeni]|uniref:Fasciclin domain-containing protein n=1 Tax=Pedobacter caeni TaxID=288992 RepID=A0A1M5BXV3_9SPHI|nr:fasciclin domain-containing protein [Pedobacter caeni]SHF47256.1 Fasciclin domain-containing protein [Pedobacter caeni]
MKTIPKFKHHSFLQYLLMVVLFFMAGCKHEEINLDQENENFRTATDFIKNNYDLTFFSAAIKRAELGDKLSQTKGITLFVPNDDAFKAVGINNVAAINQMDVETAKLLVQAHVTTSLINSSADNIPSSTIDNRFVNLNGDFLYLAGTERPSYSPASFQMYVNGAEVPTMGRDLPLSNGILHIINMPLQYAHGDLQSYLIKNTRYSVFCDALKKFGLWDKLKGSGPYTVFPVSNEKLADAGITPSSLSTMNPVDYHPFLFSSYLIPGHVLTQDPVVLFPMDFYPGPVGIYGEYVLYHTGDDDYRTGIGRKLGDYPLNRVMTGVFIYDVKKDNTLNTRYIMSSKMGLISVECTNGVVNELDEALVFPADARK